MLLKQLRGVDYLNPDRVHGQREQHHAIMADFKIIFTYGREIDFKTRTEKNIIEM